MMKTEREGWNSGSHGHQNNTLPQTEASKGTWDIAHDALLSQEPPDDLSPTNTKSPNLINQT